MNSPEFTYTIQPEHYRASVPGTGGMTVQAVVGKSIRPPQFVLEANLSSPAPLFYVEAEGDNTPFHSSRLNMGKELPPNIHATVRSLKAQAQLAANWGLGMSYQFFEAAPEETPLRVKQFTEIPQPSFAHKRLLGQHAVLRSKDDSPGTDPKKMAATAYFLNSCDLLSKVQTHLMETPDHGISFGSGQWASAEVLRYLNDRLNHFMEHTGLVRKVHTIFVEQDVHTYTLPNDLLELNRAVVLVNGQVTSLYRIDKLALDLGTPNWETLSGTPEFILEEPLEYMKIRLYPKPSANAMLEIVYTGTSEVSNITCDPVPLPSMFEPYIAWAVVADMLKREGEMHDPQRAEYAEQRYQEGIQLAMLMRGDG